MDQTKITKDVSLTFASSFRKPAHAVFQGEPVRVTHAGDAEGMSPVYNVIDAQGKSAWVPQSQVTIIDPEYLPLGQESLEALRGAAEQTSSTSAGVSSSSSSTRR